MCASLDSAPLDAVDQGILYHLQEDSRRPVTAIADELNVSDNTVRNRIEKLEANGVINGYSITINYDQANIQHHYLFICTTRVGNREELAEKAREVCGVIEVTSLMTGNQNVHIRAAAVTKRQITQIAHKLDDLGLMIEREHLIWNTECRPFSGFDPDTELY